MESYDGNKFSWPQAFANTITGKTSISAVVGFLEAIVGLSMFILITIMVLFTKDVDYLSSLITLAAMSVGLVYAGAGQMYGNKVADSKEVLADINSSLPPATNLTVQTDKANINTKD